ncbi:MAG: hypothetical protein KDI71_21050, partial [Xanthomonadales bacterium]|nr:hypothetical protein [Xanthomonadales bacterium]
MRTESGMLPAWARAVSVCVMLLWSLTALAQGFTPQFDAELDPWTTGDGDGGDNFGRALAQDGDWLAVGAPGNVLPDPDSITGTSQGTVYLYQRVGPNWEYRQTLLVPDPVHGATFGLSLAMLDDLLIAAAPRSSVPGPVDAGLVYQFSRDQSGRWNWTGTFESAAPSADGNFGQALLLRSATELLIGAPGESDRSQTGAGAVYQFIQTDGRWQLQTRLVAQVAEAGARFGSSLGLLGNDLLVGVPRAESDDRGAVERLSLATGASVARTLSTLGADSGFGEALFSSGNFIAVGAPNAAVGGTSGAGAVALFRGADLGAAPEILGSQVVEAQARFGEALWISGARLWVGAPQADVPPGFDEGVVEYYDLALPTAVFEGALVNPFPGLSGRLGKAIRIDSAGTVMLGADIDKVGPNNGQGSVSIFTPAGAGYGPPERLTRGDGASLERFGSSVVVEREWAVVSSFLERTEVGAEAGAVYVYRRVDGQWQRYQRILSPDPAVEQRFGASLALLGDRLLVGAYWDRSQGP